MRVKASGVGGSGYALPARTGETFKWVKNADGEEIKARLVDGKIVIVPGVTTILRAEAKDNLIQWAADQTARWAAEHWSELGRTSDERAYSRARYRWRDYRDERAELGTRVHEWVEQELTGGTDHPVGLNEEELLAIQNWQDLCFFNSVKPILTEFTLYNSVEGYAGTADFLLEFNGRTSLGDLKTSNGIYDAHRMQLVALSKCDILLVEVLGDWVEIPAPQWDTLDLFHVNARGWSVDTIDPDEVEYLYENFLHYLGVVRNTKALKDLRRAKERGVASAEG